MSEDLNNKINNEMENKINNEMGNKTNIIIAVGVGVLLLILYLIYIYEMPSIAYSSNFPLSFGSKAPDVSQIFNNLCE